jgi:hypothetical protein
MAASLLKPQHKKSNFSHTHTQTHKEFQTTLVTLKLSTYHGIMIAAHFQSPSVISNAIRADTYKEFQTTLVTLKLSTYHGIMIAAHFQSPSVISNAIRATTSHSLIIRRLLVVITVKQCRVWICTNIRPFLIS